MRILDSGQPPPAVTVAEFKAVTPMAESDDFDAGLTAVIAAATGTVERGTNRAIRTRAVEFMAPVTSGGCSWTRFWFPVAPVAQLTSVEVWDGAAWVALDAADYALEDAHDEPQLVLADTVRAAWGSARIRITASVGHAAGAEPAGLKQAVVLVAQEWHLAGTGLGDMVPEVRSFGAHALMRQARYIRPRVVA